MDEQRTPRTDPATWQALEDEANAMYLADTWAKKWADTEAARVALALQAADLRSTLERIEHECMVCSDMTRKLGHEAESRTWNAIAAIARGGLKGWPRL